MKFSIHGCLIPCFLKQCRKREGIFRKPKLFFIAGVDPVGDGKFAAITTGDQADSTWTADGRCDKAVFKVCALVKDAVYIGSNES